MESCASQLPLAVFCLLGVRGAVLVSCMSCLQEYVHVCLGTGAFFSMLSFLCLPHYLRVCFSIAFGRICMLDCILSGVALTFR